MHDSFRVSDLYSNAEIMQMLSVGNAGGVRVALDESGAVKRLVVLTSHTTTKQQSENPYHDRLEGDVLTYTGAGLEGDQAGGGVNARILQQRDEQFPIYGFLQVANRRDKAVGAKRWKFLGLLQYLRSYPEQQVDTSGALRRTLMFELRVHANPTVVAKSVESELMRELLLRCPPDERDEDRDVILPDASTTIDPVRLEAIRRKLLAVDPRDFEHLIQNLLVKSGFENVQVTKFSQDGGIDVNAQPGQRCWPLKHLLMQLQAKRWLHTVGRKEVAELRGSLQAHAAGCIVTTSHFSRAAIIEATAVGKTPIRTINGYELAQIVSDLDVDVA